MARGGGEQDADNLVLDETQPFGATPPVTILQQHRLRNRAGLHHFSLQELRQSGAENILASGMLGGEFVDRGGDTRGIETLVGLAPGWSHNTVHDLTGYRTAPALSLINLC